METEKPSEPDSTTLEKDVRQQFRKDEDVLCLNKKDGCFYLGTIVQVDNTYKKCLVEFLDNTQVWSSFKDLKSFAPQEPEMCYYCERSQYRDENNSMCTCGREVQQDDSEVNSSTEYYGRGLVKRSTPFPVSEQSSNVDTRFRSHAVRRARRLLNKNLKRKKKAVRKSVRDSRRNTESQEKKTSKWNYRSFPRTFEEFLELRKKKMEVDANEEQQQQPPEVRKRPQRNLLEARLNSTESKLYNPFTPVDLDSKRSKNVTNDSCGGSSKRSENSSSRKSRSQKAKSNEKQKAAKPKLVQKTIFDSFNVASQEKSRQLELVPLVSRCKVKEKDIDQMSVDSKANSVKSGRGRRSVTSESLDRTPAGSDMMDSSDDETSSRGTLEPFIPTPKDFEGNNHPFRTVTDLINFPSAQTSSNPPITLPIPLKTVISPSDPPRLKKRQLSEEDIIVDRNGQVKRRRHRYRKNTASPGSGAGGGGTLDSGSGTTTAAKSAQITAPGKGKADKKTLQPLVSNGEDFALNGKQLRGRETLRMVDKPMSRTCPLKPSPTKEPTTEDLESSVKYFFGPASRILSGEKYEVRAKRITFDGRLQCIIDWKGVPL